MMATASTDSTPAADAALTISPQVSAVQAPVTGFAASHPGATLQPAAPALPAGSVLTQVGSVLGGILLLILFAAWLVRRLGFAPQARNNKLLNVRASCQVGQRERVVIVEVDNTWLVLGVTAQQVTQLQTLPRPAVDETSADLSSDPAKPADFRQILNTYLLNKKSKHPEKSA
ncbi:flagellar biosynthetic protein FliO [Yersinia hibernica]|uniref:Flagellar protein n=1 Tax=Yersinia enterocolitica LC20 TaxID=1443113 RepID=A0A7U4GET3_YEREN|nr:flagellar biosynthetic protein FliO [Yersinia hibernica]AHM73424.2 flagellar biosynthetic protein FliO [Yersinia hibernica]OVZ84998.1 flagellar biosynthetic protein FliO [Yersinia kristensenii]